MNLTPEQFARLQQLFAEALELSPPLRAGLLARVQQEEGTALAARLQLMLGADSQQPTEVMSQPPPAADSLFTDTRSAFQEGELILQRFRIVRLLGRGGMGEVYQAEDSEIGRVALKTIRKDVRGDSSFLRRFKQEVQLARMVTSPYVCRIHELFTVPAGAGRPAIAFLTMEFLEGETLADRIASAGPLPWREAESIALLLCQGLEAIHAAGIVHRDFKSRNVMLATQHGSSRAVVMDLGLARRPEIENTPGKERTPLTLAGAIMGTPDYMAPEQFEGGTVSAATDIYALGVVLYEMVTGKPPFEASTPIAAAVRRARRPPSASSLQPGLPHRWDAVIEKCLEYEPARRFQSASELAAALHPPSESAANVRALFRGRLNPRWLGFALASVVLLAAAVVAFVIHRDSIAHKVPEAAKTFYRQATDAFHHGNYLTATRQLEEALKLDPDFVLAHARLADAFNELDSTGEAQREVNQIREELVGELPSADRAYVRAVRDTVRPDPLAAVRDYQKLAASAGSPTERANGLVDLGRANERAGKIGDAIEAYGQAARLDPYSPTPFLRRGILESRQGKQAGADADFAEAEKLYATNINFEGTSEIDYQRSYVASKLGPGHENEARRYFQQSLDAAGKMQSVALRVRALSRLSAIEFGLGHDDQAGKVAGDAIRLAEENGVSYWATDARLRLGNSWIYRDPAEAEKVLERARLEAERNQWPRLLALGQLSLAALVIQRQTQRSERQAIDFASPAERYYRTFGFAQEAFQCQVLLSKANAFFAQFPESLEHAQSALEIAGKLGSPTELLQANEATGIALFWKEDYPAAIAHFTAAFRIGRAMPADGIGGYYMSQEALLLADALRRLGRLEDAKRALSAVPDAAWSQAKFGYLRLQASLLNSQGKHKEALLAAQKALRDGADASAENWEFQLLVAEDLIRAGSTTEALAICDRILAQAAEVSPVTAAEAKLAKARAQLELRQWSLAQSLAEEAGRFFQASGLKESELASLWIAARSYAETGSKPQATAANQKIRDILAGFEHNYGTADYQLFVRRSELAEVVSDRDLPRVR